MKKHELMETESRYYVDGKRVGREDFQDIKRRALRLDTFSNANVNGVWKFYCTATLQ